jgi:hypothetical protein
MRSGTSRSAIIGIADFVNSGNSITALLTRRLQLSTARQGCMAHSNLKPEGPRDLTRKSCWLCGSGNRDRKAGKPSHALQPAFFHLFQCGQDQAGLRLLGRKKKRDLVLKALPPRLLIMLAIRHFGKLNGDRLPARLPKIICDGPGIIC